MRLLSFHSDVRALLLSMRKLELLTTYPRFLARVDSQAYAWLSGKVPTELLFTDPLSAINSCTSLAMDAIIVAPGFYYDIADTSSSGAVDFNKTDLTVIGLGRGSSQPRFDFNHADSDFLISAANVRLENLHLEATVADVKVGIGIGATADNFEIENCLLTVETTTTDEFLDGISIAAGCNDGLVKGCRIQQGLGGAAAGIVFNGASAGHRVLNNTIRGDFSTACIEGRTAASTLLDIGYNILTNGAGSNIGAEPAIDLTGNATGEIYNNYITCNLAAMTDSIVAAQCTLFNNYYNEDVSGAATGGLIGTASADDGE